MTSGGKVGAAVKHGQQAPPDGEFEGKGFDEPVTGFA